MTIVSFLLAAVLGVAGPASTVRRGQVHPRPLARGHDASAEVLAHPARELFRVDLSSGQPVVQRVGSFGTQITDIAQTGDGRIFGVSFSALFLIDGSTGRARPLGRLGSNEVNGLAAMGQRLVASTTDGLFLSVDANSGRSRAVGRFGHGVVSSGDLCFSPQGVIYMTSPAGGRPGGIDGLVRVDPSSGVATPVGSTGQRRIYGLAFVGQDLIGMTESGSIIRIDPQRGASTLLGRTAVPYWGAS